MNNHLEDIDNEYYEIDIIDDNDNDVEDEFVYEDFYKQLKVELSLKEFNRKMFTFNYKGKKVTGKPIYEMNKNNILFDIDNKLTKINLDLVEFD